MKVGLADLPLHYGKAPKWLFERMVKLGRQIIEIIILEKGKKEFLKRISDPYFFQSFGCVLGYDWHSSGLTTVLTAALKEMNLENYGIFVFGGKGRVARKTSKEIEEKNFPDSEKNELKKISKIVAKVDNCFLQDGFNLYHHCFIVIDKKNWSIVQQGMNSENRNARRYHWLSFKVRDFFEEPHKAICCDLRKNRVLNLVARESKEARKCILDLVKDNPNHLLKYVAPKNSLIKYLKMPGRHFIDIEDYKTLLNLHEFQPKNFEELALQKIGPKTIRALALISNLIFGCELSWSDPAKYSFAHGGKDGTPYRVNRKVYDESIKLLNEICEDLKLGKRDSLRRFYEIGKKV